MKYDILVKESSTLHNSSRDYGYSFRYIYSFTLVFNLLVSGVEMDELVSELTEFMTLQAANLSSTILGSVLNMVYTLAWKCVKALYRSTSCASVNGLVTRM